MGLVSRAPEQLFEHFLRGVFADHQPARPARPPRRGEERKGAAPAWQPAKAGRVHARVHHHAEETELRAAQSGPGDRKSTRLNSSHQIISYAVFCLKKKKHKIKDRGTSRETNEFT